MEDDELWTVEQCAEHWNITPVTWRSYVARRDRSGAPGPIGFDPVDGKKRWKAAEVRGWSRRGQEWRKGQKGALAPRNEPEQPTA